MHKLSACVNYFFYIFAILTFYLFTPTIFCMLQIRQVLLRQPDLSMITEAHLSAAENSRMHEFKLPNLLCGNCPSFANRWACPPYSSEIEAPIKTKKVSNLIALKIIPIEKQASAKDIIDDAREHLDFIFYNLEATQKNSSLLLAGSCICPISNNCSRRRNFLCARPEKMRYSLESLGYDVVKIAKKIFDIDILWQSDGLPQYFTLVYAICSDCDMSKKISEALTRHLGDNLKLKYIQL